MKNPCNSRLGGFTLIELLVVVLIIGILAAIALPQYQKAVLKSRYTELITITHSLRNALEVYRLSNGEYTRDLTVLDVSYPVTYRETYDNYKIVGKEISCGVDGDFGYVSCGMGNPYLRYSLGLKAKRNLCFAHESVRGICENLGGIDPVNYTGQSWRYELP